MISRPEVGLPATAPTNECAYALDIDAPTCGAPATLHLVAQSLAWGLVGMSACDQHAPVARASAEILAEHPMGVECLHGCCWRPA